MPHILSPLIKESIPGLWMEGDSYKKENIYRIEEDKLPPVNYDKHILKPHSLTHCESGLHVNNLGQSLDSFFCRPEYFYGKALVIRFDGDKFKKVSENIWHWEIEREELENKYTKLTKKFKFTPSKVLITTDNYVADDNGYHDERYILTLNVEAASYLVEQETFNGFGTSWKSTDYQPGKQGRPIHNIIFKKGLIFECLDLKNVPEGKYFFSGFPLRLENSSESPLCPVLFSESEISLF